MEIPFISETKMYHELFDNMSEEEFEENLREMEERHAAIIKEREERKRKESESTDEIYLQEIVFRDTSYCYGENIRISLPRKEISRTCQLFYSYGFILSEEQYRTLLPLCRAQDYEVYREADVYKKNIIKERYLAQEFDGPAGIEFDATSFSKYPLVTGWVAKGADQYDLPANRLYDAACKMLEEYRKSLEPQKRKKKIIKQNKKNRETENTKERK